MGGFSRVRSTGGVREKDAAGAGAGGVVCANLPTCQLFDLSAFRLVGKLESWRGAGGAGASAAGGRADTGWRVQV